jgi:hypothetical protein
MNKLLFLLALLLFSSPCWSEEPAAATDKPSFQAFRQVSGARLNVFQIQSIPNPETGLDHIRMMPVHPS